MNKLLVTLLLLFAMKTFSQTDSSKFYKSWQNYLRMSETSLFKNFQWECIGPVNIGGRIETLTASSENHDIIYAGAGTGGLWKSADGGFTWKNIFGDKTTSSIGKVEISDSNPDIVWLGTGEEQRVGTWSTPGLGIFKSVDGGTSWKNMGLNDSHSITGIAIHPTNPDIVYVSALGYRYKPATESGIYKTTDGGKNWNRVFFVDSISGIHKVLMNRKNPEILYAVLRGIRTNSTMRRIYKTEDGGKNWKLAVNGLPVESSISEIGIDISVSNPDVLYASVIHRIKVDSSVTKRVLSVFRSIDQGENWTKTSELIDDGFSTIKISPINENEVYVLSIHLWQSQDGGNTFKRLGDRIFHLYLNPGTFLHLDQMQLWIDPKNPDYLLLGNDGGVYKSEDRGINWLHLNGIPIGEFYYMALNKEVPVEIYAGNQDNSSVYGPGQMQLIDGFPDNWNYVRMDPWSGGDGFFTYRDPTDPDFFYFSYQNGYIVRKNMKTLENTGISPDMYDFDKLKTDWFTPVFISKYNLSILYYGADKIMKSVNRGSSWTKISDDLTDSLKKGYVSKLCESELNEGLLYAGTTKGTLYVTKNDGRQWTEISDSLPDKQIRCIRASKFDVKIVYVVLSGTLEDDFKPYVYVSSDYGVNWKNISANLPNEAVNVITEDSQDSRILYIGTDRGIYVSLNKGQSWQSLSYLFPAAMVQEILIHEKTDNIYVATMGRGIFTGDARCIREFLVRNANKEEAYLFDTKTARLPFEKPNLLQKATFSFYIKNPTEVKIEIIDNRGNLIKNLIRSAEAGFNQFCWDLQISPPVIDSKYYDVMGKYPEPGTYTIRMTYGKKKSIDKVFEIKKYLDN